MARRKTKKVITKKSKGRLLLLGSLSVIAFVFFCINVVSYTYKIVTLTKQEKTLSLKLDDLKTKKEELTVEIEKLQDPDYLARYARETYYYSKDGEYVIKVGDKDALEEQTTEYTNQISDIEQKLNDIKKICTKYKYVICTSTAFLGIAIIYVVKKSHR